jgi:hypothetical protein
MPSLPPETERLWSFAREQSALAGFVLIGGTALALHLRHRVSEDLDFAWVEPRLPRARLDAFRLLASEAGFHLQPHDDPAAVDEFTIAGMELHDYQQDYLVNGSVKLSFFTADESLSRVLGLSGRTEGPEIATLPQLFKSKCLVSASRSKTRDWLDLYLLMRDHRFTIQDYAAAFREAGIPGHMDNGLARLCSGQPSAHDEGWQHLLERAPTLQEMRDFFIAQRDRLETDAAASAFARGTSGRKE